jgi:hypothetical protein
MSDSEVPASPAWVSHADSAMNEVSFISTIYTALRDRADAVTLESVRCLFLAQSAGSLRRSHTSGVGVKPTYRHRSTNAIDPQLSLRLPY